MNRTFRLVALFALFCFPLAAQAQKKEDPAVEFPRRQTAIMKRCASELNALASYCLEKKMYREAAHHWEDALSYAPDDSTTRQKLGFKKKGADWVKDDRANPVDAVLP